jgi:hypothetical protein
MQPQFPEIDLRLDSNEIDAVMIALQHCVNVPYSAGFLMNLVSKINRQGQPQLLAMATHTEPASPNELDEVKPGGTD